MKAKLALALGAAMASTALVASAQQFGGGASRGRSYAIAGGPSGTQGNVAGSGAAVSRPAQLRGVQGFSPSRDVQAFSPGGERTYSGNQPYYVVNFAPENELSQQAEALGRQLAEAQSDGDREKIRGQLADLLEKQFDQRQKRHEGEIKQLEEQIKKLKDLVGKRQENRREIIGARLSQIVKESQGLGW